VNKVLLTGRLTRDPEMRSLSSGKAVTQFSIATNEYIGQGKEKAEYHNVVTWDRLAQVCGEFLGKGQQVAIEGRIQTRSWDDDRGQRHCQVSPRPLADPDVDERRTGVRLERCGRSSQWPSVQGRAPVRGRSYAMGTVQLAAANSLMLLK
jgi:single-stranded DNA-binding protein